MSKRIVRVLGVLVMSFVMLAGPLAGEGFARHRSDQYPPGARRCTVDIERVGRRLVITIDCNLGFIRRFLELRNVTIIMRSTPVELGTFPLDEHGDFKGTVPVPESVTPGLHHLEVWQGGTPTAVQSDPNPQVVMSPDGAIVSPLLERIPLTVQGEGESRKVLLGSNSNTAAVPAAGGGSSSTAPLTAAAIGLVAIGAGGAIVSRRRRNAPDAPNL